ncbi:MAG: translation initiation factor IF-3 [Betaproteobacteria bacterium]|nr:MAG: translation initiation factor IF-3 [Betaproteobacteria bacterium]
MAQDKQVRVNEMVTAPEVRLIGSDGEAIGIVDIEKALALAEEEEIDLVEIAPTAKPPVCRLMDYGKYKYNEQKKRHEAKLKQKQIQVKEVKFRPGTDEGDYQIKLRNLIRFLSDGDKAKVTLRFRGREMAHQEFGARLLERVKADLEEHGVVEQFPKMEGRQMVMVIAPLKKTEKPATKKKAKAASVS